MSTAVETVTKSAASWAFDASIMLAGAVLGLLGLVIFFDRGQLDPRWMVALLIGVPAVVLISRFPLELHNPFIGMEVGFEAAVLVFLACFDDGHGALGIWLVAQVLTEAGKRRRFDVRAFNVGLGTISGAAALLVMRQAGGLGTTTPRELLAVCLGCTAYFFVDYVASATSISLERRVSLVTELREGTTPVAVGVFVAFDTLGYLSALVERALPPWVAGLLAVPMVAILVATRALSRGVEHRRRLSALFDAAAEAQVVDSPSGLETVLRENARAAVASKHAGLRDAGPREREIGAPVRTGEGTLWLVAPAVDRARASVTADQKALDALATVGEEAFARLNLTAEMGHLARHDALTELPNRTLFLDRVEQAVVRCRRSGATLAVLFLDLDGFKGVNDRFGHAEGDELLKTVAGRLLGCVRESDSVARLGGDEFAVLLEGVENVAELHMLCRRILATLRREIRVMGHEVVVGASIGVAVAAPQDDAPGLLRNADMAMYRAKALGKDRFFVYQASLREENVRRLELVEALRRGIATELVVHYQPIVDLMREQIRGVEALVRWQRPDGLMAPDSFIAAAEQSGLITELGERVLTQVVADAPLITAAAGRPLSLSCNVSAHQLRDPAFLSLVETSLANLGEQRLVLEMTETVVVADDAETDHVLRSLRRLGAGLAIDDFGIGFSSIGYLQHLPVDTLKIDRSFVRDIDQSPRGAALVEAILVMGAALDLTVVAEGVERPEQLDQLRRVGCTFGQGFLFGRPQPVPELARSLHEGLLAGKALGAGAPGP